MTGKSVALVSNTERCALAADSDLRSLLPVASGVVTPAKVTVARAENKAVNEREKENEGEKRRSSGMDSSAIQVCFVCKQKVHLLDRFTLDGGRVCHKSCALSNQIEHFSSVKRERETTLKRRFNEPPGATTVVNGKSELQQPSSKLLASDNQPEPTAKSDSKCHCSFYELIKLAFRARFRFAMKVYFPVVRFLRQQACDED